MLVGPQHDQGVGAVPYLDAVELLSVLADFLLTHPG